jgi:hypothetical protein
MNEDREQAERDLLAQQKHTRYTDGHNFDPAKATIVLSNVSSTATNFTFAEAYEADPVEYGPLNRLQFALQHRDDFASIWIGNRISDLRYWLWRLCR